MKTPFTIGKSHFYGFDIFYYSLKLKNYQGIVSKFECESNIEGFIKNASAPVWAEILEKYPSY
jgi:hypothetical protein